MLLTYMLIVMSSPFLCVFGDDRVTCHSRVEDVPSDAGKAYS